MGQAEPDDQMIWLNTAEGPTTTVETQEVAQSTEATTIPTEPTSPAETQIPETTEVQKMQQETTETTVPLPAETEPLTKETSPSESRPEATIPPETVPSQTEPPETTPPETTVPPETEPKRHASGDIYSVLEAMAVGNSYSASAYGMTVSPELGFGNASYEFADTAYVSGLKVLGGQAYLNQMVIAKVDSLVANLRGAYGGDTDISAYRVNCYVEYDPDGELYWIYVFYG